MAKSASSKRWLRRHVTDRHVREASAQGYRSRAAGKLLEIDARDRLFRPGARVVDLGAAPGGWSQVAARKVGPQGRVVALDLLPIAPIRGVTVLRGDVTEPTQRDAVRTALDGPADVVLCDLSPNLSGIASADQARAAALVERAAAFAREVLQPEGVFLCKVFHGEAFAGLLGMLKRGFGSVQVRKPAASRSESRETYLLARAPHKA
ncbi:MAG TPA: RlmE family RNA methyltransferase [Burkholderiales bacterium]|nr:RlmE family RNA methyltransferase [Burkholderiales bacterium]